MKGIYGWDNKKKHWSWHINYMGVEVASGYCTHKGALELVIKNHGHVEWFKDTDFSF